jgi:hypothetical protein
MEKSKGLMNTKVNRRSLLTKGMMAAGAATMGAAILGGAKTTFGEGDNERLTRGDAAILRFLAAAEILETDLWVQYAELGGIGDNPPIEVDPNQAMNNYQIALSNLDGDGPQYITSNTLDEASHAAFLNAYLESKGAEPVNLDAFRTLPGSTATGSSGMTPAGSCATAVLPTPTSARRSRRRLRLRTSRRFRETTAISTALRTPTFSATITFRRSPT